VLTEARRRTVLSAMQVDCWLPRTAMPFAALPRVHMLEASKRMPVLAKTPPAKNKSPQTITTQPVARRENADKVRMQLATTQATPVKKVPSVKAQPLAAPRFSLQLLRAGDCLLLMDCPYGEFLQSREPAYLLLLDILRAAQLPLAAKPVGEPVHWPLLANHAVAQDVASARDYVQHFVHAQIEVHPCACLWLLGDDALHFAADEEAALFHELYIEGLCNAWALPTLEALLSSPALKRDLWQSMRRVMLRWKAND